MIRRCSEMDFPVMLDIINDAAQAYRGVIPADCWTEPYMSTDECLREIKDGVQFWGYVEGDELAGVMGIQHVRDVSLIRHAYVRTAKRQQGVGGKLLAALRVQTDQPLLMGTWAAAVWAVRFYQKHGFRLVTPAEKDRLLRTYWKISDRQVETSVVLADERWFEQRIEGRGTRG
ncbi:MAG TPA: GNAT family N-acetyltransferase [Syntrophales bacterium]|nr:GNAT family N-acetyltransferase [Syntrophales bacterium]